MWEKFQCSYGLNPTYQPRIFSRELELSGVDSAGEARLVSLRDHRFYAAALFLPQLNSQLGNPHPLIAAFLKAVVLNSQS